MNNSLFKPFENAPYPCYLLSNENEFRNNAAASLIKVPSPDMVEAQLAAIARENKHPSGPSRLPWISDALRIEGITVLPHEEGLFAFSNSGSSAPIDAFSTQLREPLTNVFAVLPLLAKRLEDDDLRYIEDVQTNCYRLLRIACNLENAGRLENHTYPLSTVDLASLVESVCFSAKSVISGKGIELYWEVPKRPVPVLCNPHLVSEMLLNLIRNSMQYTRDGNQIRIRLNQLSKRALLTIEDKGTGIKPEHLEQIFTPYFSTDPYGDGGSKPGLGLGLSLASQTMRGMGGSIAAESRFGEGSHFSMSFPVDKDDQQVVGSSSIDYLLNRYSPVYIQLSELCRLPGI